jgi:CRISPR-associated protein (TIGR02710 family)
MKTLILTVGTGRVGQDIANAIIYSISVQNPDMVCLVYSEKSRESTLPFIIKHLEENNITFEMFLEKEIDDVQKLVSSYGNYVDTVISKKSILQSHITVDITSGTKPMSSALLYVAIEKNIMHISYVTGERGDGGRVLAGTEKLMTLSPMKIFTEKKIRLFKEFFNSYKFGAAHDLLGKELIHPHYVKDVETYKLLANAYAAWDNFDFKIASEQLNQVDLKNPNKLSEKNINLIKKHKQWLHKLMNSGELIKEYYGDLLCNAHRRYEEKKFDDAVARLYRALEMIAQVDFIQHLGCTTSDVCPELLSEEELKKIKSRPDYDNKIKLGLFESFKLLESKNIESGKVFSIHKSSFMKLLAIRNNSILAHGITPVKEKSFTELMNLIKEKFEITCSISFPKLDI